MPGLQQTSSAANMHDFASKNKFAQFANRMHDINLPIPEGKSDEEESQYQKFDPILTNRSGEDIEDSRGNSLAHGTRSNSGSPRSMLPSAHDLSKHVGSNTALSAVPNNNSSSNEFGSKPTGLQSKASVSSKLSAQIKNE